MMGDLFAMLNDKGLNISKSPISAKNFAELVQSIKSGEISGRIAKEVFEIMVKSGDNPKKIIESKGMKQQSDPKELEKMINEILIKNKDKVDQYKSGKEKLFGFFVGQVMKLSGGKANPQLTNEILKKTFKGLVMPKQLNLTDNLEQYIIDNSERLTEVQKEIIEYNISLGDQKRLQISSPSSTITNINKKYLV